MLLNLAGGGCLNTQRRGFEAQASGLKPSRPVTISVGDWAVDNYTVKAQPAPPKGPLIEPLWPLIAGI